MSGGLSLRRLPRSALVVAALLLPFASCVGVSPVAPEELIDGCTSPAPLLGTAPAPIIGYIALFKTGVDAVEETSRLEAEYLFEANHVYTAVFRGFSVGPVEHVALAGIRCAPSVLYVEYDQPVTIGGLALAR